MRLAYAPLSAKERRAEAHEEAFFDLPDKQLRSELVAHLQAAPSRGGAPLPFSELTPPSATWLAERGITEEIQA